MTVSSAGNRVDWGTAIGCASVTRDITNLTSVLGEDHFFALD